MRAVIKMWSAAILLIVVAASASAQDLAAFEKRVTVKKLSNGLTVIVMERPEAPVFSFYTFVDVGTAQDVPGATGLAHMFEHMAFKGTDKIGTNDYTAEKTALEKVEQTYAAYDLARRQLVNPDEAKVAALEKEWKDAIAAADKFVVKNEFSKIVESNGGTGLNATTFPDQTVYFYSLPSNRFELWAYLESERFLHPVFREFYKERDVVMEERRFRVESNPIGRLLEQFVAAAFTVHPYHQAASAGWASDLRTFSATDGAELYRKFYVPSNMAVAVVGDVKAAEVMPVIEKYFGRIAGGPQPEPLRAVEPPQASERTVLLREQSQPIYLEGYHKPSGADPDSAVYDVISDILSSGRVSRLYRSLVRDKKVALQAGGFNNFPGDKYPGLFVFLGVPAQGHTALEMAEPIHAEIERLKNEDVTKEELDSVKTRAKMTLLENLDDNQGLASSLATSYMRYGDWREMFRELDRLDKVSAADIRRVAAKVFVPGNRTVGMIESAAAAPKSAAAAPASKGESK
jgi:predicted Zn-dependent peptidase